MIPYKLKHPGQFENMCDASEEFFKKYSDAVLWIKRKHIDGYGDIRFSFQTGKSISEAKAATINTKNYGLMETAELIPDFEEYFDAL